MTRPEAPNVHSLAGWAPSARASATMRMEMVRPTASSICDATVRFQMRSYSDSSSLRSSPFTWSGVRNVSPAGRMASWASCAFLILPA